MFTTKQYLMKIKDSSNGLQELFINQYYILGHQGIYKT